MANKKELTNETIKEKKAIPKSLVIELRKINIEKLPKVMTVLDIRIAPHFVKGKILLFASMIANEPITPMKIITPIPANVV